MKKFATVMALTLATSTAAMAQDYSCSQIKRVSAAREVTDVKSSPVKVSVVSQKRDCTSSEMPGMKPSDPRRKNACSSIVNLVFQNQQYDFKKKGSFFHPHGGPTAVTHYQAQDQREVKMLFSDVRKYTELQIDERDGGKSIYECTKTAGDL